MERTVGSSYLAAEIKTAWKRSFYLSHDCRSALIALRGPVNSLSLLSSLIETA